MFDNKLFEDWLDTEANKAMQKITSGKSTNSNEMMILVLKAQTNHIAHMEQDLRKEMIALRNDMDKRFEQVDKRFEQVDKRFEQVDKRFEQVDKRFDAVISRIDNFMKWSFSVTLIVGGLVVASIRYL
jgi:enoyl reductase-like protein